jgi:FkbM family methyltransferase
MGEIERINEGALALQSVVRRYSNLPVAFEAPAALGKTAPFFGYVEVETAGTAPILMFSNNDDFVAQHYFWGGPDAYEPLSVRLWAALAVTSAGIVDVGAYTGLYSLIAAKRNRKAKVFAFEALDRVFFRLKVNQAVNVLPNIRAFNVAVTETDGTVDLHIYSGESILVTGSSLVAGVTDRQVHEIRAVSSVRLDSLVAVGTLPRIDLMKVDAEGAEHQVLRGAMGAIARHKPDILCELLPTAAIAEIDSALTQLGYRYIQIDDQNMSLRSLPCLEASTGMHNLNALFTVKEFAAVQALVSG